MPSAFWPKASSAQRSERGSLDGEAALVAQAEVSKTEVLCVGPEVELTDELSVLLLAAAQDGVLLGLQALLLNLLQVGENDLLIDLLSVYVGQLNRSVDVDSLREQVDSLKISIEMQRIQTHTVI